MSENEKDTPLRASIEVQGFLKAKLLEDSGNNRVTPGYVVKRIVRDYYRAKVAAVENDKPSTRS